MVSGGAPHRLRMRVMGLIGNHEKLIVHSIKIETSTGSEMEVFDARRSYRFGRLEGVRLDEGEHGIDIGFSDSIPYEYDPDMKLKLTADVSVIKKNGTSRGKVIQEYHPYRSEEWVSPIEIIISV
jgi:hypothetical protein